MTFGFPEITILSKKQQFIPANHPTLEYMQYLREVFKDYPEELEKINWMELLDSYHLRLKCWIIFKLIPELARQKKGQVVKWKWISLFCPKAAIKYAESKIWYIIPSKEDFDKIIDSIPTHKQWNGIHSNNDIISRLLGVNHGVFKDSRAEYWITRTYSNYVWTRDSKLFHEDELSYWAYDFWTYRMEWPEFWYYSVNSWFTLHLIVDGDKLPERYVWSVVASFKKRTIAVSLNLEPKKSSD